MLTACAQMGSPSRVHRGPGASTGEDSSAPTGKILRVTAFCGLLALGLPVSAAAQAIGTMQVSARVVLATAAWLGVTEAASAARMVALDAGDQPLVRRNGLVLSRAEVRGSGA